MDAEKKSYMKRDPIEVLLEAMITGSPGDAFVNLERRGQDDLIRNEVLPREGDWDVLEAMGIQRGEIVDDLFVEATLPDGWSKRATEHQMHSDLVDNLNRVRAGIFYKAAFYDRVARISVHCRYFYGSRPVGGYGADYDRETTSFHGYVSDCGTEIWRTHSINPQDFAEKSEWFSACDDLGKMAKAWLIEHYPDYENPLAYWDGAS